VIAEYEQHIDVSATRSLLRPVGNILHPEREPGSVLDATRRSMGSLTFAAQYQQDPVVDGGNLNKWQWFKFYDKPPTRNHSDRIIVSWDTALSAKELSSYSACVVVQVRGESAYLLEVFRDRLEYPELKRKVIEFHLRWKSYTNNYALLIEKMGSGMSLIQDPRRDHIHAVAVRPKEDKMIRMNAQTARIEAGSVLLPRKAPWLDDFFQEVLAFPASRHTDQIDAFSQALNHAFNRSGQVMLVGLGPKIFVGGIEIN
jgi:predicted phage terminase large subunit-like protein